MAHPLRPDPNLVVPRASLSTASQRPELQRTGLYVLVGPDPENAGLKRIYIGEGDVIVTRLTAHNKDPDKDFWEEAIALTSKDQNLTKAQVRYLEARFISLALQAKRTSVANGKSPGETGRLPEADEVEAWQSNAVLARHEHRLRIAERSAL